MGHTLPEDPRSNKVPEKHADAFWAEVDKDGPTQDHMETPCWEWKGPDNGDGYGNKTFDGITCMAHRLAYRFAEGRIPAEKQILHKCDFKSCVNPDHLYVGTPSDNAIDGWERGQRTKLYGDDNPMAQIEYTEELKEKTKHVGEENGRAKLDPDQVLEIRHRYNDESISQTALAEDYGVSQGLIGFIVRHEAWEEVGGPKHTP